jgi:hypothetical protein
VEISQFFTKYFLPINFYRTSANVFYLGSKANISMITSLLWCVQEFASAFASVAHAQACLKLEKNIPTKFALAAWPNGATFPGGNWIYWVVRSNPVGCLFDLSLNAIGLFLSEDFVNCSS